MVSFLLPLQTGVLALSHSQAMLHLLVFIKVVRETFALL